MGISVADSDFGSGDNRSGTHTVQVPVVDTAGRVLLEDVQADRGVPECDAVLLSGGRSKDDRDMPARVIASQGEVGICPGEKQGCNPTILYVRAPEHARKRRLDYPYSCRV